MPEKDTEVMNHYVDYSVEELKTALQRIFFYSDLEDADIEEMEQILAVLRQKVPFYHPHTSEEMWAEIKEEHAKEFAALGIQKITDTEEVVKKAPEANAVETRMLPKSEKKSPKKSRGLLRVAMIAALMVVIIVAATITASAMGFNLWGWVPKWTDEDLSFSNEEAEPPIVKNIPMVLDTLGITDPLYPTWFPDGFVLTETIIETDPFFLHDAYSRGNEFLSITITLASTTTEILSYQRDEQPFYEYYAHDNCYYLFSDLEYSNATWNTEEYNVRIVGSVSLDELKRIIDSIYEVQK